MIFNKETWKEVGKGFVVSDCSIREPHRHAFIFIEDQATPDAPMSRFVFTNSEREDPDERFYPVEYTNLTFPVVATRGAKNESVVIDIGSFVYGYDDDEDNQEQRHPRELPGTDLVSGVSNIARVGDNLYSVGNPRRMHRRVGINQWQDMTADLPLPPDFLASKGEAMFAYNWHDVDGFSESDLYTVGGVGDVWRFNGKTWQQCAFPSNELLHNVCCFKDKVYIGGNLGSLWVGREDTWKQLSDHAFSMPWKDIKSFAGRLFLGSDYGLWELKDDQIVRAEVPDQVQLCSGSLDVHHAGKHLLTAGPNGASQFDGQEWKVLFDRMELE